jgi:hypothetical protein
VEVSGVWTGPVHAARAIRSLSPACAAPVVPPYTALAGAYVHYWLASRHQLLQWPNTIHNPTTISTTTPQLLKYSTSLTNPRLRHQNNRPTGRGSATANVNICGRFREEVLQGSCTPWHGHRYMIYHYIAVTSYLRLLARRRTARSRRAGIPSCRRRDGCGADLSMEGMSIPFPYQHYCVPRQRPVYFWYSFSAYQLCYVPRQRPVGRSLCTVCFRYLHVYHDNGVA